MGAPATLPRVERGGIDADKRGFVAVWNLDDVLPAGR
jgi:hypothetical protein